MFGCSWQSADSQIGAVDSHDEAKAKHCLNDCCTFHCRHRRTDGRVSEHIVRQVRSRLGHVPAVAGGANTARLAGEGVQMVVPPVATAGTRKAAGEDAALQMLAVDPLHVGCRGMVVALAVKLTAAYQFQSGLEVLGHDAVQLGAFAVARAIGFGGLSVSPCAAKVPAPLLSDACVVGHSLVPARILR